MQTDREEFVEAWQEFLEEAYEQITLGKIRQVYEEVLMENLESNRHMSMLPEEAQEALAEMGAKAYAEQAERILDSTHLGEDEMTLAMASAFLDDKRQVKVGAQAQGIIGVYWDKTETPYREEQYRDWAVDTLINPWPPHQLEDNWESVDRFKPPQDDRTYQ